ncbi:MAG: hypothetical protein KDI44_03640 [Thiothrix sp.]|nr:hypothetical protein [Thiothrix sp.]HPQ96071.1 hypothetical protein [Thiolinea sp.]
MSQTYRLVMRDKINNLREQGRVPPTAEDVQTFEQALQQGKAPAQPGPTASGQAAANNHRSGSRNSGN